MNPSFVVVKGSSGGKMTQVEQDQLRVVVDFVSESPTCVGCVVVMASSSYETAVEMRDSLDTIVRCLRD